MENFESSMNLTCKFFATRVEAGVPREKPRKHGVEHANSTQEGWKKGEKLKQCVLRGSSAVAFEVEC